MKYGILLVLFIAACGPKVKGPNKFSDDAQLVKIYEYQDQRDVKALLPLLKAKKKNHRVAAAMAFASIQDTLAIPYLNQMLQIDQDPLPRKAAAYALGQIGSSSALRILRSAFDGELYPYNRPTILEAIGKCGDSSTVQLFEKVDYQENDLRLGWAYGAFRLALKGYHSEKLNDRMIDLLDDDNKELAIVASHYVYRFLRSNGTTEYADSLIAKTKHKEVKEQIGLLTVPVHKITQEDHLNWEWTKAYNQLDNYSKAQKLLDVSIDNPKLIEFCFYILKDTAEHLVVRNAAMEKFIKVRNHISYEMWPRPTMSDGLLEALKSGDMALQSLAAIEIQKIGKLKHTPEMQKMTTQLYEACLEVKSQLQLPKQAETYIDICRAIESLGGEGFEGYKPKYNHPIDWEYVKTIPAEQQVIISTTKGNITLQLFVEDAPGTVANFLRLTDSGFYDGKSFHRVVPQFVIQGGCPRGDGWGSLDWTQRSEFSNFQRYTEGTAGIASAGKDTEGVQFFINHCATPHLDGRYTIFARVTDGMDIVNKIAVGDKIERIERP